MTLDEAIKHCEEVAEENQAVVDSCDYYEENMVKCEECVKEHRQLATWLRELKQLKEQASCKDCISREKLDKALYEHFHEEDSPNNITDVRLGAVRNFIKRFPPTNPQEPKTGHWIYSTAVNTGEIIWSKCSKCGNEERGCAQRMKYCPECGIKMQEVKK